MVRSPESTLPALAHASFSTTPIHLFCCEPPLTYAVVSPQPVRAYNPLESALGVDLDGDGIIGSTTLGYAVR